MPVPVQDFAVDDFGRFYICDDEGNPYSGPYDTLEDAYAALALFEANDDEEFEGHDCGEDTCVCRDA